MKKLVLAGLLMGGAAWADTDCHVPVQDWQPREVLRQQLAGAAHQGGRRLL